MSTFDRLRQLREMLETWTGMQDCRLLIEFHRGAWDITESEFPHDIFHTSRGTGATFDDAWDNRGHLWID